jgi:hypothetical protein
MEAADAFVVELDRIPLFTANGDGGGNFFEDTPAVGPVEHA